MSIKVCIVASAATAAMGITLGCGDGNAANRSAAETNAPAAATSAAAPAGMNTVADIVGNPDRFVGQMVTVEADVEEVLSPLAFSLDEDSPLAGGVDNDLIVLSPKSAGLADIDDQWLNNKVRVTGRVARMSVVEVEREIGWDLERKIEIEIEKPRPVLIAKSVERTQR